MGENINIKETYQGLHSGNQTLASLETEALLAGVLGRDETLEGVRPDHAIEDHRLLFGGVLVGSGDLDALADPVAAFPVGDVDVLDTDGAAYLGGMMGEKEERPKIPRMIRNPAWKEISGRGP
jgi:hypothetical protein